MQTDLKTVKVATGAMEDTVVLHLVMSLAVG
jgi:hypothetical protein